MHRPPRPAYDRLAAPLRQVSQSLTATYGRWRILSTIAVVELFSTNPSTRTSPP